MTNGMLCHGAIVMLRLETADELSAKSSMNAWLFPMNKFPLERGIRILPHLQDTGGFYVAVLRRVAADPIEPVLDPAITRCNTTTIGATVAEPGAPETADAGDAIDEVKPTPKAEKHKAEKHKVPRAYECKDEPFIVSNIEPELAQKIRDFFGLSADFPFDQLLGRSENKTQRVYYYVTQVCTWYHICVIYSTYTI